MYVLFAPKPTSTFITNISIITEACLFIPFSQKSFVLFDQIKKNYSAFCSTDQSIDGMKLDRFFLKCANYVFWASSSLKFSYL